MRGLRGVQGGSEGGLRGVRRSCCKADAFLHPLVLNLRGLRGGFGRLKGRSLRTRYIPRDCGSVEEFPNVNSPYRQPVEGAGLAPAASAAERAAWQTPSKDTYGPGLGKTETEREIPTNASAVESNGTATQHARRLVREYGFVPGKNPADDVVLFESADDAVAWAVDRFPPADPTAASAAAAAAAAAQSRMEAEEAETEAREGMAFEVVITNTFYRT
eukprot:258758-Prorocentrum_minimum.AAC.2